MLKTLRTTLAVAALLAGSYALAAEVTGQHPSSYVVQRGDTLWDISAKFLGKPWHWPEIWQANPQVRNPHLIYPGDVLSLAYTDRLSLAQGPRTEAPVDAINLAEVAPFLRDLRVVDSFEHLPRVVALEEDRLRGAGESKVYVLGLTEDQVGQRFAVVRPEGRYTLARGAAGGRYSSYQQDLDQRGRLAGRQTGNWDSTSLQAPVKGSSLGYELKKVSEGVLTSAGSVDADTGTLVLEGNGLEVRAGDRLVLADEQPYDLKFFPHAPANLPAEGRLQIMSVANALTSGGARDVVAISAGSDQGLDNGTVLSIWRNGSSVTDRQHYPESSRLDDRPRGIHGIQLPDELVGHVMIFRTFDKVSYGLVMQATDPAHVGYTLKHPDATH